MTVSSKDFLSLPKVFLPIPGRTFRGGDRDPFAKPIVYHRRKRSRERKIAGPMHLPEIPPSGAICRSWFPTAGFRIHSWQPAPRTHESEKRNELLADTFAAFPCRDVPPVLCPRSDPHVRAFPAHPAESESAQP